MKKIEAIIRQERLEIVLDALEELGYPGLTVTEVKGHGKQKGVDQQWRGRSYKVGLLPKIKVEVVVEDKDAEKIISVLLEEAKTGTGNIGDGKIFVIPVESAIRIRTGERGEIAV